MLPVDRILRQTTKPSKYNILEMITHERYQETLAKTGHNFYLLNPKAEGIKEFWNTKHAPIPKNYKLLKKVEGNDIINRVLASLPNITYDFILCHQRFGQYQFCRPLAQVLGIPIILIEHTLPVQAWPKGRVDQMAELKGDFNICITNFNRKEWKWDAVAEVITHAIDTDVFSMGEEQRENTILTVANDYINRDYVLNYGLYKRVTEGLSVRPVGDTPGLSKAPNDLSELIKTYQTSSIFFNSANWSPVPMSMLEAMSCGCAVVSMNTCAVPNYITHGENGYLANDEKEARLYLRELLNDDKLRKRFGEAARKTIQEKCSLTRFCSEWNNVFERAFNVKM